MAGRQQWNYSNIQRAIKKLKHYLYYTKFRNMEIHNIQKEEIAGLHFADHEVLDQEVDRRRRQILLDGAMALGNDYKQKVKITFETTEGIYTVETTVWAVTDNHVELKAGKDIPIKAIRVVEI